MIFIKIFGFILIFGFLENTFGVCPETFSHRTYYFNLNAVNELDIKFDIDSEYKKILNQEEPVFDIRFNGKSNKMNFTLVTDNFKILDYNITDYCIYTDFCNYTDESNSKYSVNDDKDYCYIYTTLQINKKYDKKLRFRFDKNSPNKKADIDIFLKKDTININRLDTL